VLQATNQEIMLLWVVRVGAVGDAGPGPDADAGREYSITQVADYAEDIPDGQPVEKTPYDLALLRLDRYVLHTATITRPGQTSRC
jgi:hypothetical protein